jgi:hypothetical protein
MIVMKKYISFENPLLGIAGKDAIAYNPNGGYPVNTRHIAL